MPSVYIWCARNWPSSLALALAMVWSIKAVTCSIANVPTFRVSVFSMPGNGWALVLGLPAQSVDE
eukprot:11311677-Prorocentrum_lima.AAC.1